MVGAKTQTLRTIELVECGIPLSDAKAFAKHDDYKERATIWLRVVDPASVHGQVHKPLVEDGRLTIHARPLIKQIKRVYDDHPLCWFSPSITDHIFSKELEKAMYWWDVSKT